jgi:hypothetical protein
MFGCMTDKFAIASNLPVFPARPLGSYSADDQRTDSSDLRMLKAESAAIQAAFAWIKLEGCICVTFL